MDYVAQWLANHPNVHIELEGHSDSQGSAAYNQTLSERRAKAMRDYLIRKGVASERLSYKGYGFTKPIAGNDTAEGRRKNRRVEVKIIN
jgi:outer membrane protein OmpA-like peptidoglycan-associated protein